MKRIRLFLTVCIPMAFAGFVSAQSVPSGCVKVIGGISYPCSYSNASASSRSSFTFRRSSSSSRPRSSFGVSWLNASRSSRSSFQRTSRARGCQNKHLLGQLVPSQYLDCSTEGWVFPGLVWGECPITMCMIKVKQGVFGGPTSF